MKLLSSVALLAMGVTAIHPAVFAAERAAVVVLSYNDDFVSVVGEGLYRVSMENMLSQAYSPIEYVWGRNIDEQSIPNALLAALNTGKPVDIFFSTHSGKDQIYVYDNGVIEELRPYTILSWVITPQNRGQLGTAINFGCYGDAQRDQFASLGFKSFAGFDDISAGALALSDFMKHWTNCESLSQSIAETNLAQRKLLTESDVGSALFSQIAGGGTYQAELRGYGKNDFLCRRH